MKFIAILELVPSNYSKIQYLHGNGLLALYIICDVCVHDSGEMSEDEPEFMFDVFNDWLTNFWHFGGSSEDLVSSSLEDRSKVARKIDILDGSTPKVIKFSSLTLQFSMSVIIHCFSSYVVTRIGFPIE